MASLLLFLKMKDFPTGQKVKMSRGSSSILTHEPIAVYLPALVICCCVPNHPKLSCLKTINNLSQFLWIRNLGVTEVGGSGLVSLMRVRCWLGLQLPEDLTGAGRCDFSVAHSRDCQVCAGCGQVSSGPPQQELCFLSSLL